MRRSIALLVAILAVACGGTSPTAPSLDHGTPSTGGPPPAPDARAACSPPLSHQEEISTRTLTFTSTTAALTSVSPHNEASKVFVRMSWAPGAPPISFHATAQTVDYSQPVQHRGETIMTSTPESATSAVACWVNPPAADVQIVGTVVPGTQTVTILRVYPAR